jgi:hypothetical protein
LGNEVEPHCPSGPATGPPKPKAKILYAVALAAAGSVSTGPSAPQARKTGSTHAQGRVWSARPGPPYDAGNKVEPHCPRGPATGPPRPKAQIILLLTLPWRCRWHAQGGHARPQLLLWRQCKWGPDCGATGSPGAQEAPQRAPFALEAHEQLRARGAACACYAASLVPPAQRRWSTGTRVWLESPKTPKGFQRLSDGPGKTQFTFPAVMPPLIGGLAGVEEPETLKG